ncbi:transmembrane protein 132A, partial [Salarias fasciatus]|uniref:transmembrane protein 132A n=1 Tax=Salarias fasciatus TaxID=181472 RepID=UPI0011770218
MVEEMGSHFEALWTITVLASCWGKKFLSFVLESFKPPPPLSLPVHMSVIPPSWKLLPLLQPDLGPLFSNSSPFSFSQSVFLLPPPGRTPRPGLRASFGPYSATQVVPDPSTPSSAPPAAFLLSEHVEREGAEGGRQGFRVRVLFHRPGPTTSCVTLHAFRETEERRASCVPQPPLGLCLASLALPAAWFEDRPPTQLRRDLDQWYRSVRPGRRMQKRGRRHRGNRAASPTRDHRGEDGDAPIKAPRALRYQSPPKNQVQLYSSSWDSGAALKPAAAGCVQDGPAQSQNQLFYIRAVGLRENPQNQTPSQEPEDTCLGGRDGEELDVDSHVVVRYHKGPVLIGQPVKVSVSLRANFSAHLVVIRLRVKKGSVSMVAQRTPTELWAVTLERSQGSKHDVVSVFCHKRRPAAALHDPTLLQQVACLSIDGLRRSFTGATTVSAEWWAEYSGRRNLPPPHGAAVSRFSFARRHIVAIAAVPEGAAIVNTAVLNSRPVSLSVSVLAVSQGDAVLDVTSAVTCRSANQDAIKVSSDCSSVFVDGSESGPGESCAVVEFQLGALRRVLCFTVWTPSVPLRLSLSDPVLNAIQGWNVFTEDGCVPVYQRSSVQVLTQFRARDSHGRTTHLLGSADWLVDVTELVQDWLRVRDPGVAFLGPHSTLVGLRPGKTSLHVVSEQWDGFLGSCELTVTSETVAPGDLSVQVVGGLGLSVTTNPAHPSVVTATVTAYNIMYNHQQEASISVWLQFSDDTSSLLSTFGDLPFLLDLSSVAESVVAVATGPGPRILARGDGGGPLVRAELLISSCADRPVDGDDGGRRDAEGRGPGTLARGSGWVRVNLDPGLPQRTDEDMDFDMLVETDGDVFTSTRDERGNLSSSGDAGGGGGAPGPNPLDPLDRTLYFSPSQDGDSRGEDEGAGQGAGPHEQGVGTGTILSLLGLTAVLFLVNCLPCALPDWKTKTRTE